MLHPTLTTLALLGISLAPAGASLVAYYPLDGNFTDASGNGNNGTMFGGVSYTGDVPGALGAGQSAAFDGAAGTYGAVDTGLSLSTRNRFSVSMWVKGDGTANSDDRVFSEGSSSNNNPLFNVGTHNQSADGTVDIYIRNGGGAQTYGHAYSSGTAFDNTWHHIAFLGGTEDGQLDLFIDGSFNSTFDYSNVPDFGNSLDTTTIGGILRGGDCCNFLGSIDEVSFWEDDLTGGQIALLANGVDALTVAAIPEPSSFLLSLSGLLVFIRRRR